MILLSESRIKKNLTVFYEMADDVKNEPKIVVNGNEHLLKDLSDEQKKFYIIFHEI